MALVRTSMVPRLEVVHANSGTRERPTGNYVLRLSMPMEMFYSVRSSRDTELGYRTNIIAVALRDAGMPVLYNEAHEIPYLFVQAGELRVDEDVYRHALVFTWRGERSASLRRTLPEVDTDGYLAPTFTDIASGIDYARGTDSTVYHTPPDATSARLPRSIEEAVRPTPKAELVAEFATRKIRIRRGSDD